MARISREKQYEVTGQLMSAMVTAGYGVAVRRIGEDPLLTAFATDDLGAVEYYSTGNSVTESIVNLYELIQRKRGENEPPF